MATRARPPPAMPAPAPLTPPPELVPRLAALGVVVEPEAVARVGAFLARLIATNAHMNLTAIVDPAEAWERHAFDALTLLGPLAQLPAGARVADVGSGGGVPALPLAIARPDLEFTLIEATQKKGVFLTATASALGLANVRVESARAEALARDPRFAGRFHAVTARAVARLAALVPLTVPLLAPGGVALLVKGQKADEELAEAEAVITAHGAAAEDTRVTPTGRIVILRKATSPRAAADSPRRV